MRWRNMPFHAGEDPVQIEGFRLENLLAAIGQELPGQRGGAIGGLADFGRVFGQRTPGGKIAQQQFALADDGRQDAVELVRDAARPVCRPFPFSGIGTTGLRAVCAR